MNNRAVITAPIPAQKESPTESAQLSRRREESEMIGILNAFAFGCFLGSVIAEVFGDEQVARITRAAGLALLTAWLYWK